MKEYRFPPVSRFVVLITMAVIIAVGAVCAWVYFAYEDVGGYITASVGGMLVALLLLVWFSQPRRVRIGDGYLEIRCRLELVRLPLNDIVKVRRIPVEQAHRYVPLVASYGIWGFMGWFTGGGFRVRMYATRLKNLVEITSRGSIRRVVISATDPEALTRIIKEASR